MIVIFFSRRKVYSGYLEKLIQQETRDNCLWGDWKSLIEETVRILCDALHLDLRRTLAKNLQRLQEEQEESPRQHCSLIENKELQEFFRSKYSPMNILRYVHIKKVGFQLLCLFSFLIALNSRTQSNSFIFRMNNNYCLILIQ